MAVIRGRNLLSVVPRVVGIGAVGRAVRARARARAGLSRRGHAVRSSIVWVQALLPRLRHVVAAVFDVGVSRVDRNGIFVAGAGLLEEDEAGEEGIAGDDAG